MMYRANIPADLDVLDSPLLSPTPIGSALLGNVPGSALAERIFNDPQSWEDLSHEPAVDPVAWFVDEIEKLRVNSASSSIDSASTDDGLKLPVEKARLTPSPASTFKDGRESRLMDFKRRNVRPISLAALFDRSGDDFVKDVQAHLHKLNEGLDHIPGTADIFSPMSDSSSLATANTDLISPTPIYSASTTLSFLDLYLDSPSRSNLRKSLQARSRPRTPALQIPSEPVPRPASSLSPMLAHPDMSVEPLKRGASVPPLDQVIVGLPSSNPPPTAIFSPEPKPSLPPGLTQPPASTPKTSKDYGSRGLPHPTPPPPYTRTPSPATRFTPAKTSGSPPSAPQTVATPTGTPAGTPSGTPVRRLPTIPLRSASTSSVTSSAINSGTPARPPRAASASPVPSSLLSPEPAPSQNITFQSRPMAIRSPLGGPIGPRSRVSMGGRQGSPSSGINRSASGLSRRPPVLQL